MKDHWRLHISTIVVLLMRFFQRIILCQFNTKISIAWPLKSIKKQIIFQLVISKNYLLLKINLVYLAPQWTQRSAGKVILRYFWAVLWNSIPNSIKCATSVKVFKSRIKSWEPVWFCRLWKTYLQGVEFVNTTNYILTTIISL